MAPERDAVCAIVNPRSGAGRTERRIHEIRAALAAHFREVDLRRTEGPGGGRDVARRAYGEGHRRFVAVGGDGTVHDVVNGLMADGIPEPEERAVLSVVHAGTGGDFVKTLGTPTRLGAAVAQIASATPRPCDVIQCEFQGADGGRETRYCINVLGFGLNGEVVRRANRSSKRLGGRLTFAKATLEALLAYEAPTVRVTWTAADGTDGVWEGLLASAFVANGGRCGGGMVVGRGVLDDGVVDLSLIPDLPVWRTILATPHLYDGRLRNVKEVSSAAVVAMEASVHRGKSVLVDLDGEQPGCLPLSAVVVSKAVLVA
jgi:diacylglycerol kinase family enzyme